jgi:hypothetical protein
VSTVLVSLITAVATSAILGVFISPWLERRKMLMGYRQEFRNHLLAIGAACELLKAANLGPDRPGYKLIQADRDRWKDKISASSEWLIDNVETYGFTYTRLLGYQLLVIRWAGAVRAVWLSQQTMEKKLEVLTELTEHLRFILFAPAWRRVRHVMVRKVELERLLDDLEGRSGDDQPAALDASAT